MILETRVCDGYLMALVSGEIDLSVADELRSRLDNQLEASGLKKLVLDLSNVSFIDSSGLGVILGRYKKLQNIGGKIVIIGASPTVKRILELSGIMRIIEVSDDRSLYYSQ